MARNPLQSNQAHHELLWLAAATQADTFGTGDNAFEIDFVTIGDPGNAADTTGDPNPAGAVP